jgi:hypothetical protein
VGTSRECVPRMRREILVVTARTRQVRRMADVKEEHRRHAQPPGAAARIEGGRQRIRRSFQPGYELWMGTVVRCDDDVAP